MALQARQLEKRLAEDGVPVTFFASNFPLPRGTGFCERLPLVRTLIRAGAIWLKLPLAMRRADVVHLLAASWVYFFVVVYPTVLVARCCGKRVIVNYRGGEAREFFGRYGWLAGPVFRLASAITAPSQFLAEVIRGRFGVEVAIVPNLLDTSLFQFRERTELRPTLLVTRHLEAIYDIDSVLRAFQVIQSSYPEATLWIAGRGSHESRLRKLSDVLALRNVRFLGHVQHQDLPGIYDQCDIYLNASRVDNFPGALIEAAAAGLAIVSTGAGGIPYIFSHGTTALLVSPGDWQGLADAVQNVLTYSSRRLAMTRAALQVANACDWREVRKTLYAAYNWEFMAPGAKEPSQEGTPCGAG